MSAKTDRKAKVKGPTTFERKKKEKKESTRNKTQKPQKHPQPLKIKRSKVHQVKFMLP